MCHDALSQISSTAVSPCAAYGVLHQASKAVVSVLTGQRAPHRSSIGSGWVGT
jgi:hypothetical protein